MLCIENVINTIHSRDQSKPTAAFLYCTPVFDLLAVHHVPWRMDELVHHIRVCRTGRFITTREVGHTRAVGRVGSLYPEGVRGWFTIPGKWYGLVRHT